MGIIPKIWDEEVKRRLTKADVQDKEIRNLLDVPPELLPQSVVVDNVYTDSITPTDVIDLIHSPKPLDHIPQTFTRTNVYAAGWPTWAAGYKDTAVDWLRRQVEEICAAGRSNL